MKDHNMQSEKKGQNKSTYIRLLCQ